MTKDDKQTEAGTQNWLRTATLVLTILSPVINNMASRLADRLEQGGGRQVAGVDMQEVDAEDLSDMLEDGDAQTVDVQEVDVEDLPDFLQGKVATTRSSLGDTLQDLKDHPYTQQLRKRGETLNEELQDLVERGSQLSQRLLARGSGVTSDLADRGNKASQELLKRSGEARKELRKRGKKLNKKLNKRSQKLAKELRKRSDKVAKQLRKRSREIASRNAGQSGLVWIIAGFSVGLTAAGVAAYILIRQRIEQQQQLEEAQSIQVPQNGYANATTSTPVPSSQETGFTRAATQPEAIVQAQPALLEDTMPAIAVQGNSAPAAAAFVGIVETRQYYPVGTQRDQLSASNKNDVVYFISEDEAKAKGYTSGV
ncbi:MAG TPA: hypothetical protein VGU68_00555 [Ktedonobacteraceae bacterium]|nr:hypothetical protein [Ktedonobacteraceae bacterium]